MKLRLVAEALTPPMPGGQAPLAQRLGEMVKSGKLKAAQVFPDGSYHLHRYYGVTEQDKAQLIRMGAWYQDSTGDWILDVRKVPGAIPNPAAARPGMPTKPGTPAAAPALQPLMKTALTKLVAALKAKKVEASAATTGLALMQHAGLSQEEFATLKNSPYLKRDPAMGGYEVDTTKLGEVRRQYGIN